MTVGGPDPQSDWRPGAVRPAIKELRLALVCYGGVSLAIYMHGITKELHKLVTASKGLETSPEQDPFDGQGSESVYWHALRDLRDEQGVATHVVVDIISGTSAGGINGVYLAKALAGNLSQDALRDMWMVQGDLRELIRSRLPTLPLKFGGWVLGSSLGRLMGRSPKPPLDGDKMLRLLRKALDRMDARVDPVRLAGASLVPDGEVLELFVTATDLSGYTRWAQSYSPKQLPDRWHRHVFEFHTGDGRDRFTQDYNLALAFAARASSCFPGAFAPVGASDVMRVLKPAGWPGSFADDFARIYELSGADVFEASFIDGGVLDNFPFGLAIDAITNKPAGNEVDRRLLFIEPDPMVPTVEQPALKTGRTRRDRPVPGMLGTIWAGLSTIPRHEPVLTELQLVRARNERVEQVLDVIASAQQAISDDVSRLLGPDGAPPSGDWEAFTEANRAITEQAAERVGVNHVTYVRVKLRGIVDRMAALAARIRGFPEDSNHADFVQDVIRQWGALEGYLETTSEPTPEQLAFVRAFDLGYRERRLRFVIKGINDLYGDVDTRSEAPLRRDLDQAKNALWSYIVRLQSVVKQLAEAEAGSAAEISTAVAAIFEPDRISSILSESRADTIDQAVSEFTHNVRVDLNRVRDQLREYLESELKAFGTDVYRSLQETMNGWAEDVRHRISVRYLGFPYWDRLIYPLQYVSDIAELNRIEVIRLSPNDVQALGRLPANEKLKGVARGHFGAFFKREYRENDYLWGRLDGAERLLWTLFDAGASSQSSEAYYSRAFRAILDEEQGTLRKIPKLFEELESHDDLAPSERR